MMTSIVALWAGLNVGVFEVHVCQFFQLLDASVHNYRGAIFGEVWFSRTATLGLSSWQEVHGTREVLSCVDGHPFSQDLCC